MHHNINMFTTGNTHLKYRKHPVHSAAHKLKIRSSRLVQTTAGTDLDSTDRVAIGGAKNSSASKPLKRPILSLWNSRASNTNTRGNPLRNVHVPKTRLRQRSLGSLVTGHGLYAQIGHASHVLSVKPVSRTLSKECK